MPVREDRSGLPHRLVKHWHGPWSDTFEQHEFGRGEALTEGEAVPAPCRGGVVNTSLGRRGGSARGTPGDAEAAEPGEAPCKGLCESG